VIPSVKVRWDGGAVGDNGERVGRVLVGISNSGYRWQPRRSVLFFIFASSIICHCMFAGESALPQTSGMIWSTTYPGRPLGRREVGRSPGPTRTWTGRYTPADTTYVVAHPLH